MELNARNFANYGLESSFDDLSETEVERTKQFILDTIGCALRAYSSQPSEILRGLYGSDAGTRSDATIFGEGGRTDIESAVLINATMGRYLDFSDTYTGSYGGSHPSDHVPALISIAEMEGASGEDLIDAINVAYDIQCTGVESGEVYRTGFDYQSVWGTYSSTVAIGKLLGLNEEELANAIRISGTASNPLIVSRRGDVTMWKGVAMPFVIQKSLQACKMAEKGMVGPRDLFAGQGGFFEAISDGEFTLPLGEGGHRVMDVHLKVDNGCYQGLSAVAAVLDICENHEFDHSDVQAINVLTTEFTIHTIATPKKWETDLSAETADHSLPYMIAAALYDEELTPRQYEPDRLNNEEIHHLMSLVDVESDEDLEDAKEANPGMIPTIVEIRTAEETYSVRVDYPPGNANTTVTQSQFTSKFRRLVEDSLDEETVDTLIDNVMAIDQADSMDPIVDNVVF
jgi:2-methylcitrate dehydratase